MGLDFVLPQDRPQGAGTYDVVIVGAGPAGLTAAIYSSRARLATLVLERNTAGGQMGITERVENFPGFPEAISGFDLAERMKSQAAQFGTDLREITTVAALEPEADGTWRVVTDEEAIHTRAVILAPGVESRKLGVPGENEFLGRGVSYCATCDGALYRNRQVAVIGGGDSAVEEGLFLTKFADAVHVIHRRDELRAQKITQERAFANPKMHWIWNAQVRRILGEQKVEGVDYQDKLTKVVSTLAVDGVFVYVGMLPNTKFLESVITLDQTGYIVTDDLKRTNQPGVFACGDAVAGPIKQISWAVGEGALAAIQVEKYLEALKHPTVEPFAPAAAGETLPQTAPVDAAPDS